MAHPTSVNARNASAVNDLDRRSFMLALSAVGLGGSALWQQAQQQGAITAEMLAQAESVYGLEFTDEERELMVRNLNRNLTSYEALRTHDIPNAVPPAIVFDPVLPGMQLPTEEKEFRYTRPAGVSMRITGRSLSPLSRPLSSPTLTRPMMPWPHIVLYPSLCRKSTPTSPSGVTGSVR